ncbi:MAG: hypothetical protein JWM80_777 [Cyanobacteria bacterium RYN_339]|nr:hypothetical protein [Cyanobacteria bacterium RYN_339]
MGGAWVSTVTSLSYPGYKGLIPNEREEPAVQHAPDLTQRPPRSPRTRLGGYVLLARMLDKCRATLVGKNGEFNYACPLDQHFITFTGIDAEALKAEVAKGLGDGELLEWIAANAPLKRAPYEIAAWSAYFNERGPDSDNETLLYFAGAIANFSTTREDIKSWFDLLDLDDHCTFGGKP